MSISYAPGAEKRGEQRFPLLNGPSLAVLRSTVDSAGSFNLKTFNFDRETRSVDADQHSGVLIDPSLCL